MSGRGRSWNGTVRMTEDRYSGLAEVLGAALREERCAPIPIGDDSYDEQVALYVAVNHEGFVCYGGQTRPRICGGKAASRRISQHLSEEDKAAAWAEYWVFPLRDDTSHDEIDRLERKLNSRLAIPLRRRKQSGSGRAAS